MINEYKTKIRDFYTALLLTFQSVSGEKLEIKSDLTHSSPHNPPSSTHLLHFNHQTLGFMTIIDHRDSCEPPILRPLQPRFVEDRHLPHADPCCARAPLSRGSSPRKATLLRTSPLGPSRGNPRLSLFFLIFIQYHNNSNIRSIDELVMVHFRFPDRARLTSLVDIVPIMSFASY